MAPVVLGFHQFLLEGDGTQEGNIHLLGGDFASVFSKNRDLRAAFRTDESAHVFYHSQNLHIELFGKIDALARIEDCHLLRRGHDHASVEVGNQLRHGEGFITRTRRGIDYQIVQFTPVDIGEKLLNYAYLEGATPDHRGVRTVTSHGKAHDLQVLYHLKGLDPVFIGHELGV